MKRIEIPVSEIEKGPPPPHVNFFKDGNAAGLLAFLRARGITDVKRIVHFVKDPDGRRYVIYYAAEAEAA